MSLSAIIIDDESDAISVLDSIVNTYIEDVTILAKVDKPTLAPDIIRKYQPDFIFLDIEMPGMNGFELLSCISNINFEIIFVTAYNQYAIEAIKKNALDYILKPINISEVVQAVEKVKSKIVANTSRSDDFSNLTQEMMKLQFNFVKIPSLAGIDFIDANNVIHIEASGAYTLLHTLDGKKQLISKPIKQMEELFYHNFFFRIHRSHIINLKCVKRLLYTNSGSVVLTNNTEVPLARRKKDEFTQIMSMSDK